MEERRMNAASAIEATVDRLHLIENELLEHGRSGTPMPAVKCGELAVLAREAAAFIDGRQARSGRRSS